MVLLYAGPTTRELPTSEAPLQTHEFRYGRLGVQCVDEWVLEPPSPDPSPLSPPDPPPPRVLRDLAAWAGGRGPGVVPRPVPNTGPGAFRR